MRSPHEPGRESRCSESDFSLGQAGREVHRTVAQQALRHAHQTFAGLSREG